MEAILQQKEREDKLNSAKRKVSHMLMLDATC